MGYLLGVLNLKSSLFFFQLSLVSFFSVFFKAQPDHLDLK